MAKVSISLDSSVTYPLNEDHFPQRTYAEYPFKFSLVGGNQPYGLVRKCLQHFGADRKHFGTPVWNPSVSVRSFSPLLGYFQDVSDGVARQLKGYQPVGLASTMKRYTRKLQGK